MQIFHEAAGSIQGPIIREWKADGRPVVGYSCSYVPAELLEAAGLLPVRLRGIETEGMEIGDAYFGPFICSFPKCILQLAGKGELSYLDGVIITPGCDAMRRLDDCWRKAGEDYPGIVPDFFYYFDVPHKSEAHGMQWYLEEMRALKGSLEARFGTEITDDRLREAISRYNRGRQLLKAVEELRTRDDVPVSGTDVFAATVAGTVMPRDAYNHHLETWLKGLEASGAAFGRGKKRLMLVGSVTDEVDLFRLVESGGEAVIVAENLCFGVRYEGDEIPETGDPLAALGAHYLGRSVCPRMFGKYRERLERLKERIRAARVDAVIMQNIRFCDLHGAENALFERDLEAMGIPCLRLEREYGPLVETGRLMLRINAFLERIAAQ